MKQIFSSYPDGIAGFALFILRGSAVALLVAVLQTPDSLAEWLKILMVVVGAALVLGFGTRPAVALCAFIVALTVPTSYVVPMASLVSQFLGLFGLLLLGPGAISIDARLFGRRKILLPK